MRKKYTAPGLIEFGTVGVLTLGVNGSVPDVDISLNNINNTCPEEELGGGLKTVLCVVLSG